MTVGCWRVLVKVGKELAQASKGMRLLCGGSVRKMGGERWGGEGLKQQDCLPDVFALALHGEGWV